MSIDGDVVVKKSRLRLYSPPFLKKSVSTLLRLDAQMNLLTGSPIFLAIYAARMLPKLPVGTQTLILSPCAMVPAATISQYAET